jgi:hypothetical protein
MKNPITTKYFFTYGHKTNDNFHIISVDDSIMKHDILQNYQYQHLHRAESGMNGTPVNSLHIKVDNNTFNQLKKKYKPITINMPNNEYNAWNNLRYGV